MEQAIKQKLKLIIFVSKLVYPKYAPFWFIIYMYLIYFRIAKRRIKYKVVSIPSQSILSYSEIRKCFDDVNNIAVVNDQNLYKYDKLLKLSHAGNANFRNVYVVPSIECKVNELLVSECLYYNLTNVGLVDSIELGNFNEKLVKFADEIVISVVSSPLDINNSLVDTILEKYFKMPKLVNTGDMIVLDVKYFAQDLFYINSKINNIDKIYFKCSKVLFGNSEVNYNCFCAVGETAIRQSTNIQSFIPKQFLMRNRNFDTELSLCPYGLKEHLCNIQRAVKPFLYKRKLNLGPAFLVQGNAGSGKGILLSSLASFLGMHFYKINNSDLIANVYAQNEAKLRNLFFTGKMAAPCVVALHNFENYGKNNDGHYDERLMANFADELAILFENNLHPILLFCCTSKNIPLELKKLFLQTFDISAPTDIQREQNLKWIIEEKGIKTNANLVNIANKTHGFLFEDLRALVYYAEEDFKINTLQCDIIITEKNLTNAVEFMQGNYNSSLGAPKVPKVQWSDVGGLDDVKEEIIKTINLPLKYPEFLKKSGLKRSGILLFGPPGTGKTLIAKAVATECSLCFLSVKGPELLNMYVGQSEQNIREVFERARQASPCIIFFDELDSIAPNRGMSGDSGGVMDRVVSQLLAEMDGLNESATVFIMAATNRPDLIDPALLRPGRFDKLLFVGACTDPESKTSVLQALTRKFNLSKNVNLAEVANMCPLNITGADFYGICSNAWSSAVKRLLGQIESGLIVSEHVSSTDVVVEYNDFKIAIENVKPSISPKDLIYFEKLKSELTYNE